MMSSTCTNNSVQSNSSCHWACSDDESWGWSWVCSPGKLLVAGSSMALWIIMVPSKLTVFGRIADGTLFLHNARCDFVHLSMRITGLSCILIFFWVSGSLTHGQLSQILHAGKDNYCFAVNVKTGPKQTLSNSSLLARAISTNTSY